MLILTIMGNTTKVTTSLQIHTVTKWCHLEPQHVKLNIDASFYADSHARANVGVLLD
jgi:hypothetical protein